MDWEGWDKISMLTIYISLKLYLKCIERQFYLMSEKCGLKIQLKIA